MNFGSISIVSDVMNERYYAFSKYLKEKYGEKTYKIPVNIKTTCPNRDGSKGTGGCIFCGEEGAGFELQDFEISIEEQIKSNIRFIRQKYKAKKYIVYLQNYTSTYLPIKTFSSNILRIIDCTDDLAAIYISTRPDCISEEYLVFLEKTKKRYNVDIVIELGLQTVNENSLKSINRGHDISSFIDGADRTHAHDIDVCAHCILDLPFDSIDDVKNMATLINELKIEQVKCHSLYIVKGSVLAQMYQNGEVEPISYGDYLERVILFIRTIDKEIVFQRLIGRAPKDRTLFCNWGKSWWKIRDEILDTMKKNNYSQGDFQSQKK